MACCIVAALLIAVYHRLAPWRARRALSDDGFAPTANRPAPGEASAAFLPPRHPDRTLDTRTGVAAWTLRFVAVGLGVYLAMSALLVTCGIATGDAAQTIWLVRTAGALLLAAVAIRVASRLMRRGDDPCTRSQIVGCACVGIAIASLELMALDMHVASLYHVHNVTLHTVMHVLPLAAAFVGLLLAFPSSVRPSSRLEDDDRITAERPVSSVPAVEPGDERDGHRVDARRVGVAALSVRSGAPAGR
ncbi:MULTISPECIES: hypothetical protein [unclassified Gordonia (in: high G+C Gram-positive bacteria)]|uniref:hypothetical protein n=1 Tax=unclassified Gordonia (in: high G+C Gram-positive bacteria) TaxID=2657482 RepID=UPI001F0FDA41|nr:hypothetical protein [Gordonia sp. ABSL49_1]MCH5641127.1 hypothetical protein [Gordonia sp. ABSL49_1]